jgi:hypothetical protein
MELIAYRNILPVASLEVVTTDHLVSFLGKLSCRMAA